MKKRAKLIGGPEDGDTVEVLADGYEVYEIVGPSFKEWLTKSDCPPFGIKVWLYMNSGLQDKDGNFIYFIISERMVRD